MHREDAATVSYTEAAVYSTAIQMLYLDGAPCQCAQGRAKIYQLVSVQN
jgi:hypothetical protein